MRLWPLIVPRTPFARWRSVRLSRFGWFNGADYGFSILHMGWLCMRLVRNGRYERCMACESFHP